MDDGALDGDSTAVESRGVGGGVLGVGKASDKPVSLQSYRDLRVWQSAMNLTAACYKLTREFPKEELFGLTSQIRRAASSIPSNIAEGYGRRNRAEYLQFLHIAQGSLKELETHLLIALRVAIVSSQQVESILVDCETAGKQLGALIAALQKKTA